MEIQEIDTASMKEAFALTRKIALGHYENFPVGSILLPSAIRPHFYNLYAFMRTADDFADLPHRSSEERLQLLRDWRQQLHELYAGFKPRSLTFLALATTIKQFDLAQAPFERLLDAFEFDARQSVKFETFEDLQWYTSRSAEPVGELVLALFGYRDQMRIALSNKICSALQLINFIQDAGEDIDSGRVYFPKEDWQGIESAKSPRQSRGFGKVALRLLARADRLLSEGSRLPDTVRGRLRFELRAVLIEAKKMSMKIKSQGGETLEKRPKLSKFEHVVSLLESLKAPGTISAE